MSGFIFNFGKYKNMSFNDVYEKDKNYLLFLYNRRKNYPLSNTLIEEIESRFQEKNTVYLNFGKHKGKSIHNIKEVDPSYLSYLLSNQYVRDKMPELYKYVEMLTK